MYSKEKKIGVIRNFLKIVIYIKGFIGIKVLWQLQFLEYLRVEGGPYI